jgi:hypothetical protein
MLLTRRDAIGRTAAAGLGMIAGAAARGSAQAFPPIPSWPTELRQLAPNVYAYTQATGPGVNNARAGLPTGPTRRETRGMRFVSTPSSTAR